MDTTFDIASLKLQLQQKGFSAIKGFLSAAQCADMLNAFTQLSNGSYDTQIYPDQWLWQGTNEQAAILFVSNAWKANRQVASLVLCERLGRLVGELTGWDGVRLAMDSMLWKPADGRAVNFHQDSAYMRCFAPDDSVTVWIPFDDTQEDMGTLEYCVGSHLWQAEQDLTQADTPKHYRDTVLAAAESCGQTDLEFAAVAVGAGTAMIHNGTVWHGSGVNRQDRPRRSIAIHFIKEDTVFNDSPYGFIFRRYQLLDSNALNEAFFPVVYSKRGYRSSNTR